MLYICSKDKTVNEYWTNEFQKYNVKLIESDYFLDNNKFNKDDVIILDLDQFDSLDDIMKVYNTIPKSAKVIALVKTPKLAHGTYMIKHGFKSYLGKETPSIVIKQALLTVLQDNVWLYPELMNYIIKHINVTSQDNQKENILEKLTAKEAEVASCVAQGFSNNEIAQKLGIQPVTVKKHIGNIFNKLNVKDRVSLAIKINENE